MRRIGLVVAVSVTIVSFVGVSPAGATQGHNWLVKHRHQVKALATDLGNASHTFLALLSKPSTVTIAKADTACETLTAERVAVTTWKVPSGARVAVIRLQEAMASFARNCLEAITAQTSGKALECMAKAATVRTRLTGDFKHFLNALR